MPRPPHQTAPLTNPPAAASHTVPLDGSVGEVWSLDVTGLDAVKLAGHAGVSSLRGLFEAIVAEANLHPVAEPIWHMFGGQHAGVTGIVALSESHLACHTFPEHGGLTLDLYTCVARPTLGKEGFWAELLGVHVGLCSVSPTITMRRSRRSLAEASPNADTPALQENGE